MGKLDNTLLAAVLNSGEPGVIVLDPNERIVFLNDWLSQIAKIPVKKAEGKTLKELFPKLANSALFKSVSEVLKSGTCKKFSSAEDDHLFTFETIEGEPMVLEIQIRPFAAEGAIHCLMQVRDRTAREKEVKLLKQQTATMEVLADNYLISEMNTRAIIDSAMEAIITIDADGRIESFNPAAEEIFAIQVVDVLGKGLDVLMGEPWSVEGELFSLDLVGDDGLHLETMGKRPGRDNFHLEVTLSRMQVDEHNRYIMTGRDISDRKDAEARIEYMAFNDSLTDLPNRVLFRERLNQAIINSRRAGTGFALMALDLDYFKQVNDTFGHHVGDQFLISMSNRLKGSVRETDTIARIGGDEFAVIVTNLATPDRALLVAETIEEMVGQPLSIDGHNFTGSASIGIAFYPDHSIVDKDLMVCADRALYQAKAEGRGCFVLYKEGMTGETRG